MDLGRSRYRGRKVGWLKTDCDLAARRFVLHRNTLSRWRNKFLDGKDVGTVFGPAPFNKLGDAVRWLVHELRDLCVDYYLHVQESTAPIHACALSWE